MSGQKTMATTSRRRALIVLNPAAGHGRARQRWERVRPTLAERFDAEVVETGGTQAWEAAVARAFEAGVRVFVAAGGDGTVNALLNALVQSALRAELRTVELAAVGLGSSNDFHKPFGGMIGPVPLRIGSAHARDVGRARYVDEQGAEHERMFVVSASLGVTAVANAFFNHGDATLRALKARWVGGAIVYAAVRTISRERALQATLRMPAATLTTRIANLSVMKSPYLSGSFRYDTPIDDANGLLAVNLCEQRSQLGLLRALAGLARGRFLGREGTHHWMASELEVELTQEADLELDGEVVRARRVRFDVLPERIGVCQ